MKSLIIIPFFLFAAVCLKSVCFAQNSQAGQIFRSQEELEEQRGLRRRIEQGRKIFVKKIIVEGVTLASSEELNQIILSYEKKWLTRDDIRQILSLIKDAYKNRGHPLSEDKISHQIKKSQLIIKIKE